MPDTDAPGKELEVAQALSPALVEQFGKMAMMVPSETTDAVENIVAAILNAPSWDELDAPWESQGLAKLEGKVFIINDLSRRPSDFKDGLGIFLVVHCTDAKTGEAIVTTTSATAVVAQLVAAYARGWFPLHAQVIVAERATKNGYRPHHLKFLGSGQVTAPPAAAPAAPRNAAAAQAEQPAEPPY